MKTQTRDELKNALRFILRTNKYHTRVPVPAFSVTFYVVTSDSLSRALYYAGASYSARRSAELLRSKGLAVGVLVSANALSFSAGKLETLEREAAQYLTYTEAVA
jgi:hypothetical protein